VPGEEVHKAVLDAALRDVPEVMRLNKEFLDGLYRGVVEPDKVPDEVEVCRGKDEKRRCSKKPAKHHGDNDEVVKDCYRQVAGRHPPKWKKKGKITTGALLNMLMCRLHCKNCKSNASPEVRNPSELCQLLERAFMIHRNERNPVVHNEKFMDHYSEAQNILSQFLQIIDGIIVKCRVLDAETHKNSEAFFYSLQHILSEDRLELT